MDFEVAVAKAVAPRAAALECKALLKAPLLTN